MEDASEKCKTIRGFSLNNTLSSYTTPRRSQSRGTIPLNSDLAERLFSCTVNAGGMGVKMAMSLRFETTGCPSKILATL
jgi:hypothetical protein